MTIPRYYLTVIACVLGGALIGCAEMHKEAPVAATAQQTVERFPEAQSPPPADKSGGMMGGMGGSSGGGSEEGESASLAAAVDTSKPAAERMLIYTASMRLAVLDVEASLAAAQKCAEEAGGYLAEMTSNSITLRVPAKQFRAVMERLKALGRLLDKNIKAEDVTDEYVDLQLRLKNAEALRDRFEGILKEAKTVKDALEVEKELARVCEEIERIKGQLTVLDKQVAFSTIQVQFERMAEKRVEVQLPELPFPWLDRLGVESVMRIGR